MSIPTHSPIGPPLDPAALYRGIEALLTPNREKMSPQMAFSAVNLLRGHLETTAAAAKIGKKPTTLPKIRLRILVVGDGVFVGAVHKNLRNFGPQFGVSFIADYNGIGQGGDEYGCTWMRGVDGGVSATMANIRSWKNRIKSPNIIIGATRDYPLVDAIGVGSTCILEVADGESLCECAARFAKYSIHNVGNRLYFVGELAHSAGEIGSAAWDFLTAAAISAPFMSEDYTDD